MRQYLNLTMAIALSLTSGLAVAAEAIAPNTTMGVQDGVYQGHGHSKSLTAFVPNLKFTSIREIRNGSIRVKTQAHLFGVTVGKAEANLKISNVTNGHFELKNLDSGEVIGKGLCTTTECTFEATVLEGNLFLRETWVADGDKFLLVNGYQNFFNKEATYEGEFHILGR